MSPASTISIVKSRPQVAIKTAPVENTVTAPEEETSERYPSLPSAAENKSFPNDPVFITAEQQPSFRGGMLGFYKFLAANLRYPDAMMRYHVQGKVIVEMTIEKDGSLSDIKTLSDIGSGSAEEAIRVLKLSPKWSPGYQNGQPVRVRYTLPIVFNLVSVKNEPDTVTKVTYTFNADEDAKPPVTERIVGNADTIDRKYNMIMANDFDFQSDAVFLVDGKVVPNINSLDPASIKTLKVVRHVSKDDSYYRQYGPKSLNGIVMIELKSH